MTAFLQILLGGVIVGAAYALIAIGFSLVYRVTGVINLAQGAFCVFAALLCWTLEEALGWPVVAAVPAAIAGTTLFGLALGWISFVPGLAKLSNANMLMLTSGLLTLVEGLLLAIWGSQPYSLEAFAGARPIAVGGMLVPAQAPWVIGTALLVIVALWYLLTRTRLGQALRACAENPTAARLMGIGVPDMTLFAFALAAAIGAVAGVVVAPTTSLQFNTGGLFTISGFIAVAIGGLASLPGAIAGGLLLGIVTQLATAYVSSLFSSAITLGLLLIVLVFRPHGLLRPGVVRRQDVRDEPRVWKHIVRLKPGMAWGSGLLALLVAALLPLVITSDGVLSGLVIAGILFIALIGLDIAMGYAGQVSLGQAGFMAVGGYGAAYLVIQYEIEPLLGIAAAIALALVCSLILSVVTLRLSGLYLALATLAFGLLIDSCAVGFTEITGGPSGLVGIPSFAIGAYSFDTPIQSYYLILGLDAALVILLAGAMRTGFGRVLQAIRTDQMAAAALGVRVVRVKMAAFALSAGLAALSGALYAFFFHYLSPDMVGTSRSFELVAMLVIGGEGTLVGPLLGSALITMLPTLFQPLALYKTFASGGLLVACFLYLPQGLFGVIAGRLDRLSRWRGRPTLPSLARLPGSGVR